MALRHAGIHTGPLHALLPLSSDACSLPLWQLPAERWEESERRRTWTERQAEEILLVFTWKEFKRRGYQEMLLLYISCESLVSLSFAPSFTCLAVYLLHWKAYAVRLNGGRWGGANTDLMTYVFLSRPIGGRCAFLLALIGALYCALLQDYYINWSDSITLGNARERSTSYPCRYTHHSLGLSAQSVYLAAFQAATRTVGSFMTSLTNGLLFLERGMQLFRVMIYVVFPVHNDCGELPYQSPLDFSLNPLSRLLGEDVPLFSKTMKINQLKMQFLR